MSTHGFSRRLARITPAALCALALACRGITDPPLPAAAERFAPPPVYARWWALAEACSGVSRPLATVQFYHLPGAAQIPDATAPQGARTLGYWSPASNRIVLAGAYTDDGPLVRHEMLHALVRATGHPPDTFQGRCAGVVTCPDDCRRDGSPPPAAPSDAPVLPLSALRLRVAALPAQVSRSGSGGALTLVVEATNPSTGPVWVTLEPSPGLSAPWVRWFGFRLVPAATPVPVPEVEASGYAGSFTTNSTRRVGFGPGQTRRLVYDLSATWYPPGGYLAVGFFNARQSSTQLTVLP